MELKKDIEELKQDVEVNIDVKQDSIETPTQETSQDNNKLPVTTFEDAKNQALQNFKPTYDSTKSMFENGKDIARTIGVSEALKDDDFIEEMKRGAQKNIRTDMNTDQNDADTKNQASYYKKYKPVLKFAKMDEPCNLSLMKWTFVFAVIPYILKLIIGGIGNVIKSFFEAINDLFNSIIGIPEYVTNPNTHELILDDKGNPITKNVKVNLLTKIVFWFLFATICVTIIFAIVKGVTGFDIVQSIKNLIQG